METGQTQRLGTLPEDKTVAASLLLFFTTLALNTMIQNPLVTYAASVLPLGLLVNKAYRSENHEALKKLAPFCLLFGVLYPLVEYLVFPIDWGKYTTQGPYLIHSSLHICFVVAFSALTVSYVTYRFAKNLPQAIIMAFSVSMIGDTIFTILHVLSNNVEYHNVKAAFWVVPLAAPITDSLGFAALPLAHRLKQPWGVLFFCLVLTVVWAVLYPTI